jgi:hypothetical protein
MRDNPIGAGNQQGSPLKKSDPSETTRRTPHTSELEAYLLGALHDGTYNRQHKTFRFSQRGRAWLETLQRFLNRLGHRSWLYREGKLRKVYVLETTASFLDTRFDPRMLRSAKERIAYIRGYFDAEGGIPRSRASRFYIQLCQKNRMEMEYVRITLEMMGVRCGALHNPSKAVDPDYWRFFIRTTSHTDFVRVISSWHPRKQRVLKRRMMI